MTKTEEIQVERGSGNVYRDFGDPDADVHQAKAKLAAQIIGLLNDEGLSVRQAQKLTGFAASDFSRIRNADLGRFTIDRLIRILGSLGQSVEVRLDVRPRALIAEPQAG
ncbi:MAG: helix-turn-helix transcriptional regulator [Acidobacteriota bacterium]|nr:helix-turn-helix transcriptional regulator [Acidobacteriota bacterium]